jgi:hypothetical protein
MLLLLRLCLLQLSAAVASALSQGCQTDLLPPLLLAVVQLSFANVLCPILFLLPLSAAALSCGGKGLESSLPDGPAATAAGDTAPAVWQRRVWQSAGSCSSASTWARQPEQ